MQLKVPVMTLEVCSGNAQVQVYVKRNATNNKYHAQKRLPSAPCMGESVSFVHCGYYSYEFWLLFIIELISLDIKFKFAFVKFGHC